MTQVRLPALDVHRLADLITEEQVQKLDSDGAICIRQVFGPEWVEALREAAERNMENPGPLCDEHAAAQGTSGRFHDDQFLWLRHDTFREFVLRSGAGAIAARAMASSTAHIFYDQLLVKEPGTTAPTPWHNDTSYWHLSGRQICSTWVALDSVGADAGVRYVKGSHKWQLMHAVTNFSGGDNSDKNTYSTRQSGLPPVPDISSGVERGEYELLSWDMQAGDVLLFYSATLHGAPGNNKANASRRRGYACRWLGDDVRFDPRPGTMNEGWCKAGYNNGLQPGAFMACELHPNVLAA